MTTSNSARPNWGVPAVSNVLMLAFRRIMSNRNATVPDLAIPKPRSRQLLLSYISAVG
jgi:hypothetical protein